MITEKEPIEIDNIDRDVILPVSSIKGKPIKLTAGQSITITYPDVGFDPDNLTFDGIEIKKGDKVQIGNDCDKYEVDVDDNYIPSRKGIYVGEMQEGGVWYDIQCFNIVAHYPKQSELEKAKEELGNIYKQIKNEQYLNTNIDDYLEHYYQARKQLEELENNN